MIHQMFFNWWKVWTAGKPVQHLDSSTTKQCCCNRCRMWFNIVFLKYARPSLKNMLPGCKQMLLYNPHIPFSIDGAFPDVQDAHSIGTDASPYHQKCRLLNWALTTSRIVHILFSPKDKASMGWKNNFTFKLVWPQNSFPTLPQSFLNEL